MHTPGATATRGGWAAAQKPKTVPISTVCRASDARNSGRRCPARRERPAGSGSCRG